MTFGPIKFQEKSPLQLTQHETVVGADFYQLHSEYL